jgi:hypothetical protein
LGRFSKYFGDEPVSLLEFLQDREWWLHTVGFLIGPE